MSGRFIGACWLALTVSWVAPLSAQPYPTKPVRIVTAEVGSANDLVARMSAQGLTSIFGQQFIVDNRGAGLTVDIVARAQPDGYTLLLFGSAVWTSPFMRDNWPWDPTRDLTAITAGVSAPNVLAVHPSVPVKSAAELIVLAKARPGHLNYGAGTIGASPHLSAELFKSMAGVNILWVPFKGTGPAVTALIGGQLHLMFVGTGSITPHVKAGRVKALAVTSLNPTPLMPGVPILANDVAGYESASMMGFFGPAKLPPHVLQRLSKEIVGVLRQPETSERLLATGNEVIANGPAEFSAIVKSEMAKWGKLIREARLKHEPL
jgi:tripartite-type tricarboxylate transporter receptor subunit TctC